MHVRINKRICDLVRAAHSATDLGKLCAVLAEMRELVKEHGMPPDPAAHGVDLNALPTFGADTEPSLRTQGAISWDRWMILVRVGGYWTMMQRPDYQARKFTMH